MRARWETLVGLTMVAFVSLKAGGIALARGETGPSHAIGLASFVDEKGGVVSIDDECVTGDKCDKKWLAMKYSERDGRRVSVLVEPGSEAAAGVSGIEDLLAKALIETHRFRVVDDGDTDFRITASVQAGAMEGRSSGGGMAGLGHRLLGAIGGGVGKSKSTLQLALRIINSRTHEVEAVQTVQGSSSATSWNLGGLAAGLVGNRVGAGAANVARNRAVSKAGVRQLAATAFSRIADPIRNGG